MVPEGWETTQIGHIAKVQVGRDVQVSRFSERRTDQHLYPVFSNTVDEQGLYGFYDFEEYPGGAVTVVGRGIGLGTAFHKERPFGAIGRLVVLHPLDEKFCPKFLTDYINHCLRIHNESGGIPQLPGSSLARYSVTLPPLPEQQKIAEILSTWDRAIEVSEARLKAAQTQKRALMQTLLTGKTRFPEFEGRPWKEGRLIDHFDFINGRAFKPDDWGDIGLPIIRIQNLTGSTGAFNRYDGDVDEKHMVRHGDFLLSWSATLDTFIWRDEDAVLNQHIFKVLPLGSTLKMFGFHLITYEIGKLVSKVHGTSMKHITKKDLAQIVSSFPSIAEQERITEVLDDADSGIEILRQDTENLRTEKKALMQQLLTGKRRVAL